MACGTRAYTSSTLAYNALDAVTQASDFNGVTTIYARDARGNATSESSADIGNQSTRYDALGPTPNPGVTSFAEFVSRGGPVPIQGPWQPK
ncbi:hypothetical protein H6CHR_02890 [Variovorax sp. PBL-H6]|nr:hypothetical protein H6CHR_02890 [Variovorax sp. PBL-H6]